MSNPPKPTPEQVQAEIQALRELKPKVRLRTAFGDSNPQAIQAQIDTLEQGLDVDDIEARWPDERQRYYNDTAYEAAQWRDGDSDELPSASWQNLIQ